MDALLFVWNVLGSIGGGLSVLFIVILSIVLALLAFVYVGAAVVVLQRFARASHAPGLRLWWALGWSAALALLATHVQRPELEFGTWAEWLAAVGLRFAIALPATLAAMWTTAFAIAGVGRIRPLAALLVWAGLGVVASWLTGTPPTRSLVVGAPLGLVGGAVLGLLPLAGAGLLEIRRGPEWFIALRYLVAERRQVFISIITLICIGAVASGVWLIITVLSVMNGFERTWRDEIVGNYAHVVVRSYYGRIVDYEPLLETLREIDGVVAASPYVEADGMVRVSGTGIAPIRLRGIEVDTAVDVTSIADKVVAGGIRAIESGADRERPAVLLGASLAKRLQVAVGDEVILISPEGGAPTPLGPSPRLIRFEVVGLFESSFMQYDDLYAYTSLAAAQDFLGIPDVVEGLELRTADFYRSLRVASLAEDALGHPFFARDWKELFPQFFQALNDNRSLMFMLLIMIMVVSAFVIIVTLMMMIMAKSSDVGILKTMGASNESIELIFAVEGTLIGIAGVAVGVLAGMAVSTQLAWIQDRIEAIIGIDTLPASIYNVASLPSEVDPVQVIGVVSIALVLSLGATLLPSQHGARLDPVEALRDE